MKPLTLKLCYLTGRSVATTYNDRVSAEWPPHPARIYSALVAIWADSEERDADARAALEWLATLEAPSLYASAASRRQVVPHFVPVNDVSVLDTMERQRQKLDELASEAAFALVDHENALSGGDQKAIEKTKKSLEKAKKTHKTSSEKLEALIANDQQLYAADKHSDAGIKNARALLPEARGKQPRLFPSVSPEDPTVYVRWSAPAPEVERHRNALADLANKLVRVGHSTSFVACCVVEDCPTPNWEPREGGSEVLRVPGPGQLSQLESAFELHREIEPRVLPCRFQRYEPVGREVHEIPSQSLFGKDWIVFRQVKGRRLAQTAAVSLARVLRGALMSQLGDEVPELLSGHSQGGEPSQLPHLAIVPLPFVGHAHASGDLLGIALVFPKVADAAQRTTVLRAIGQWEAKRRVDLEDGEVETPPLELTLGHAGMIELERIEWGVSPLKTLRAERWCQTSYSWVTVTPIALDRNPGDLVSRDPEKAAAAYEAAQSTIASACERIGLPRPSHVQVHPSVPLRGAVKARAYPPFPSDPSKNQRVKVHARIEFPVPVEGPMLLGAGRYFGLGLCLPLPQDHEAVVDA